jgi:N-acetylglucosamine-6-phosphate deacetylase
MAHVITHAKIYTGEAVISNGFIRFDRKILALGPMTKYQAVEDDVILDGSDQIVIPGFVDVHSHGGYGVDVMDADPEAINQMTYKMLAEGITSYFPTTMTQSDENIEKALKAIRKAKETNPMIQGIHLEGPFVSPAYKGAQDDQYMRPADVDKVKYWNDISGGNIRIITYAPEIGETSEFEAYCKANNIILAAGHTGATYDELKKSEVTHITHLFNGQLGLHHREVGPVGYGLLEEKIFVEIIIDGFHLSPEVVKLVYQSKGVDKILLITDSMRAKGEPEGWSELGGQKVYVKDKQARLENDSLAGSVLTFIDAFKNVMDMTGCRIEEAVKMSAVNQAREFGLDKKGRLTEGNDADILLLNNALDINMTVLKGRFYDNRK